MANTTAVAGDTIYLRDGTYTTTIQPSNSGGNAATRIIYRAYTGERPIVTVSGSGGFTITGKDYITIDGISFIDCLWWGRIQNGSDYNEIVNCNFSTIGFVNLSKGIYVWTAGGSPSTHNWLHRNTFGRNLVDPTNCGDEGGQLFLGVSGYGNADNNNTVENNVFHSGGHHLLETYSKYNVIRDNVFHNEGFFSQGGCKWGASSRNSKYGNRNVQIYDGNSNEGMYNLLENNRMGYAAFAVDGGQEGNLTITAPKNIVRYNYSYYSETFGIAFKVGAGSNGIDNRVYNNTLYYNGQDSQIFPNAWTGFGDVDWRGGFGCHQSTNNTNIIKNNLIYQSYGSRDVMNTSTYSCTGKLTNANNWKTTDGNPLFVNVDISDPTSLTLPGLSLRSDSPAINGGTYLTQANGAGSGSTKLIVDDAMYYQDGTWGSDLTRGATLFPDWISIGSVGNTVQIASINYTTNTITLASPISWSDNANIWLYKKSDGAVVLVGSAPDFGASEFGTVAGTLPLPPTKLETLVR